MKNIFYILPLVLLLATCKKEKKATPSEDPAPSRYSVSYNGNGNTGGTAPADGTAYDSGNSAVVKDNDGNLVKTGFSFAGWNTSSDGNGTNYLPGSALAISNSNITLYARWLDNSTSSLFKITYNGNGNTTGTVPADNTSYVSGSQVTVKSGSGLEKSGTIFDGWNTSSGGSGQSYSAGDKVNIQSNLTLYAMYSAGSSSSGKYIGFNASGQVKSKSSLSSSWSSEDLSNTFGSSNLVSAVWDGSKYIGFNASGQVKSKSSLTSSWSNEDLSSTFGSSNVVSVVWNGSKYIAFNASGQTKSKSSLTSSWSNEDLSSTFGSSNVVSVVWNGSKYIGFNASGQAKSKSSLTSSWSNEDLSSTFGSSNVVSVVWNGSKYIGFNASGQTKSKSSLTSSWSSEDLSSTFGSSNLECAVYR